MTDFPGFDPGFTLDRPDPDEIAEAFGQAILDNERDRTPESSYRVAELMTAWRESAGHNEPDEELPFLEADL